MAEQGKSNAVGRPSKFNKNIIKQAQLYLDSGFKEQGNVVPTIAGLAFFLKISRDTLYEWEGSIEEFSDILETIRNAQEMILIDNGLVGNFNPTITKLMLTKHGYSDKQEQTVNGNMQLQVETTPISSIFEK